MNNLSRIVACRTGAVLTAGALAIGTAGAVANAASAMHGTHPVTSAYGGGQQKFGPYGSFEQCDNWWVQVSQAPNIQSETSCAPDSGGWSFWATFSGRGF
jgi:hypothetical protein